MSGLSYRVRIESKEIGQALQKLLDEVQDRSGFHNLVGEHLLTSVEERFETQTSPDGAAWQALSPVTVAQRLRSSSTAPVTILRQSGRLAGSINYEANSEQTRVGTSLVYAAIHHFGGEAGRGHAVTIPARPYLGLSPEDEEAIIKIAEDWLQN